MNTRYEMSLTPLFNKQGEVVLLYLKDKFDELWMCQHPLKEPWLYEVKIETLSFLKEDERITRLRQVYQSMKEQEDGLGESSERIEWEIPQYVDSFLNMETVIEDITDQGTLCINDDSTSFLWWTTDSEWLNRLARNQNRVMVNIMTKGDKEE